MTEQSFIHKYLMEKAGTIKDYKEEWQWDRYLVGDKMYAAFCTPNETHAAEYSNHLLLTLKCDPVESGFLREQYDDILPGFYMDKRNWISVKLDGTIPESLIFHLCDLSYQLVFQKLTKKKQKEILDNH